MRIPYSVKYGMAALSLAGAARTPTVASAQSSAAGMRDGKGPFSASINACLPTHALTGLWRYRDDTRKFGQPIQSLNLNGAQIGAPFRW